MSNAKLLGIAFIKVTVKLFFIFISAYSFITSARQDAFSASVQLLLLGFATFLFGIDFSNAIERRLRKETKVKDSGVAIKALFIRLLAVGIAYFCMMQSLAAPQDSVAEYIFRMVFYFCFWFTGPILYEMTTKTLSESSHRV